MARKEKIMLVKMTVEWASDNPHGEQQTTETEIQNVGPLVDVMLKLNAISVTIEKVEEGE